MSSKVKISEKDLALRRIAGYVVQLSLYTNTFVTAGRKMKEKLPQHPELQVCEYMSPVYATYWNITSQVIYIIYGFVCDVAFLLNVDSYIPLGVRKYRYTLFTGLVGPYAWGIFLFFWPIYFYDRELIFPKKSDLVLSSWDNIVAHAFIVTFVLWEVSNLPKDSVKGSSYCLKHIVVQNVLYIYVVLYARFISVGVYPYDVLTVTKASFLHYLLIFASWMCCFAGYYLQLWFKDTVWRFRESASILTKEKSLF